MDIFGWVSDYAGCGYYRIALPLRTLRQTYPEITTQASMVIPLEDAAAADLIICQRTYKKSSTDWIAAASKAGRAILFEIDDDLWNIHPTSSVYEEFQDPGVRDRLRRNAAAATAVAVTNDYLADVMRKMNPEVHVVPNYVDDRYLTWDRPQTDRPTVGWAGSATHLLDFQLVAPTLRRFFTKYPDWDMHFMGTDYSHLIKRPSYVSGWSSTDNYLEALDFDIGLAPLVDNEFNRSKSPIKALEYAVLGIPVIASDAGPYHDFVRHGVTGFLVRREHEWMKYLRLLAEDADLRGSMGRAAREQAAEWTIQRNIDQWRGIYAGVAAQGIKGDDFPAYFDMDVIERPDAMAAAQRAYKRSKQTSYLLSR